jgi:hypothetical protein
VTVTRGHFLPLQSCKIDFAATLQQLCHIRVGPPAITPL